MSWTHLLPVYPGATDFGLAQTEHARFEVQARLGAPRRKAYSMMVIYELVALHHLARTEWAGRGDIIDLGPYFGLTTFSLASGMALNQKVDEADKAKRLHSYDLFLDYDRPGESIFPEFMELNARWAPYLQAYPGDVTAIRALDRPVEILFVDLAKSAAIHDHVVQQWFPRLVEGGALVQQDYVHFDEWWIHVFMEQFKDRFHLREFIHGASALYRLTAPIPEAATWSLDQLDPARVRKLHRDHVEAADPTVQGVLWCAHARMLVSQGRPDEAREALAKVEAVKTEEPWRDFSLIVPSNVAAVERLL